MAIDLVTKFLPYVDEQFATESKKSLLTNQNFDWNGAHSVKVYKVSTGKMNDYDRKGTGSGKTGSRYGEVESLDATTEEFTLKKDRSFTFVIDKLDKDETGQQLQAASALARQQREKVIPEVDQYTYGVMCANAGIKPAAITLTSANIYDEIIKANNELDNAEVPETGRYLMVIPDVYVLMKKCKDITMETDIGNDMRVRGVIANLDGLAVMKIPANRLPRNFGFMIAHPCATVAPTKLEDYKIHEDAPGISGSLVEGRIVYDAFVLDNKQKAIYYQVQTAEQETPETPSTGQDET
ncbi:MAG: hypothetical protein HFI07_08160 [Lachnospiraceae bacterium]|nr:hypothetical protein [Lachnospiraceae bacterium]